MVLASTNDSVPLDELAQLADKIVEVAVPQTVSAVQSATFGNELDKLKSEVAGLRKLIKSLPSQRNNRPHSPSPTPANNINDPSICWYHQKYGSSARKCKPPCKHSENSTSSIATMNATDRQANHLFHIIDKTFGVRFLVDTGAEVSVIPPSRTERKHSQQAFTLQAVNNTAITIYGYKSLTLDLGLRRTFRWIFIIADVQNPILGADFLRSYSLLVDMKQQTSGFLDTTQSPRYCCPRIITHAVPHSSTFNPVCEITACHRTFSGEKHYLSVHVYICTEIMSG